MAKKLRIVIIHPAYCIDLLPYFVHHACKFIMIWDLENYATIVTTGISYIDSYLGKLIGTFYDEEGNPTKDLKRVTKRRIQAEKLVQQQKKDEEKFPNCNSRWSEANGGEVYLLLHHCYFSTVWFTWNVTFQLNGILWVPPEFTLNSLTTSM